MAVYIKIAVHDALQWDWYGIQTRSR